MVDAQVEAMAQMDEDGNNEVTFEEFEPWCAAASTAAFTGGGSQLCSQVAIERREAGPAQRHH